MSHHYVQQSDDIQYDPVPLGQEHTQDVLYDQPPSPGPPSPGTHSFEFYTPNNEPIGLPEGVLPPGAAQPQPRFLGAALYDDGNPRPRESLASSHRSLAGYGYGAEGDANSSVYALNYGGITTPTQRDSFAGTYRDDPRESGFYAEQVPIDSLSKTHGNYLGDKRATYIAPRAKSRRKFVILAVLGTLILVIAAVLVPLYFFVFKKHSGTASDSNNGTTGGGGGGGGGGSPGSNSQSAAITGGDGSKVTLEDGSTFTYSNSFGGYWYWDANDPFNNGAKAQSWTPALNETFNYGTDRIRGVNIGGWLTLEPFMQVESFRNCLDIVDLYLTHLSSPALFEKYLSNPTPPVDEWTLSQAMAADTASGGLQQQLEEHYKTFITEADFAQIAGAGLNFVRIPLPYWAIETRDNEPFLAKTAWTYFLKGVNWARKYGLRINLDFHALPGSQNGWNHSGRLGTVNVLNGPMGLANAQRSLDYIRIIAEFISQPEYKDVIPLFGITNEPQGPVIGQENLQRYYLQAYNNVREASGVGQGNGPYVSIHEGFLGLAKWADYLPNADRLALDIHPYLCFGAQSAATMDTYATTPCTSWGALINGSMGTFGMTTAGEWSNAVTDCGLWVNGVGLGTRYEGNYSSGSSPRVGSCDTWTNWQAYDATMKKNIQIFAEASMDALQNWFFWTWKIGNSSVSGTVESPAWSYSLGLQNGWMPNDPRSAIGACGNANPWSAPLAPWQTGGAGAGQILAAVTASYAWPPTSISNAGAATLLPSYTATGVVPTLPVPSFTPTGTASRSSISAGNGWGNPSDTAGAMVAISTCSYLDPWIGPDAQPPSPLCGGAAAKRHLDLMPRITQAPPL